MTASLTEQTVPFSELAAHWPTASVPELLARMEELTSVAQELHAHCTDCDLTTFERIRVIARTLDNLDRYGLLRGPIRARYLAAIAALTR